MRAEIVDDVGCGQFVDPPRHREEQRLIRLVEEVETGRKVILPELLEGIGGYPETVQQLQKQSLRRTIFEVPVQRLRAEVQLRQLAIPGKSRPVIEGPLHAAARHWRSQSRLQHGPRAEGG